MGRNKPYAGVPEAIASFDAPFYIASSKGATRLLPLLKYLFNLDFPPDSPRIFASLIPPNARKIETLRSCPSPCFFFFFLGVGWGAGGVGKGQQL